MKTNKIKAWGIFTKEGELLFTDKEACIYDSKTSALKEKGSHEIKAIEIRIIGKGMR